MPPSFGTSGLRGLVVDLTDDLVAGYVRAFLAVCPHGGCLYVGRDLRPSSPRIAAAVLAAARGVGVDTVDCGALPTPALARAAIADGAAAVMVTGSHIPADRNGLKFYVPDGEVSKAHEARIRTAYAEGARPQGGGTGRMRPDGGAARAYVSRYVDGFGAQALAGMRIGVWRHSSVARDALEEVLAGLGAGVVALGHSDDFVPVDTEAVDEGTRAQLAQWCAAHRLDAVVSTDGDADRPLVTDAAGAVVAGDVLGVVTARALGARVVVTPVSSNDMVRRVPDFDAVHLTRIGSPYVVAGMEGVLAADADARVAGFEANGGFLLGHAARGMAPLMTRDALLPIVAPLAEARARGVRLADLVADLPPVFTAADRVQRIDRDRADAFLARLDADPGARKDFFTDTGAIVSVDRTDGLRLSFEGGHIVHLRPSGNAPEFRVYAQADTPSAARDLVAHTMGRVAREVGGHA